MSREYERHKARCASAKDAARRQAALNLDGKFGATFHLSGWTVKAQEAYRDQWLTNPRHEDADWDWDEIFRRHRDPDNLEIVIWSPGDRLSGIGFCLVTGKSVEIRFVEGDNRADCPLKGYRALIILECATCYAQGLGKGELRAQPINASLQELYVDTYGFIVDREGRGDPYYRKKV